jgi:hypothetical protein
MVGYTEKIKEIAGRLLKECTVDMVIGFRKGTMPMMNEPCFATTPDAVDTLWWDSNCGINLANYLTNRKEKVAVDRQRLRLAQHRHPYHREQDQARPGVHHRRSLHGNDRQTQDHRHGGR